MDEETRLELEKELHDLRVWLSRHDYIGIKIATGRATPADYADEIEQMRQSAERITEIEELLRGEENEENN